MAARFNYGHLTEQQHARNRVSKAIQQHIEAGTLTPEELLEIRRRYFEEVDGLDVPARIHDSVDLTVQLLGDCTEEDIRVYLATGTMPEREERHRRLAEMREEAARAEANEG